MRPRPPEAVELYASSPPTRAHVDVALLEATQEPDSLDNTHAMLAKLRKRAGDMGCDAVYIKGISGSGAVPLFSDDSDQKTLTGTCVVFTDAPPTSR
jgi:hypothetical protein